MISVKLPTRKTLKKFAIEAFMGFVLWTLLLTPYMWFFVCLGSIEAYCNWLVMEVILIPPFALIVVNATNWITKKLGLTKPEGRVLFHKVKPEPPKKVVE